jgi:hypothetical protein
VTLRPEYLAQKLTTGLVAASRDPLEHSEHTRGYMTILSLEQAARLTGRGKTILARAISGRLFAGSKEDRGNNSDEAELARVYPFLSSCRDGGRVAQPSRPSRGAVDRFESDA